MASLSPLEFQLNDAIEAAAERLHVPVDVAPIIVWRLAMYGGHVAGVASSEARQELSAALELSKSAGAWIRRDSQGYAEAVNLAEWREITPQITLHRARSPAPNRFSPTPLEHVALGPIHARRGSGLTREPVTFCAPNVAVDENPEQTTVVTVPNSDDDWCIVCEQCVAALVEK